MVKTKIYLELYDVYFVGTFPYKVAPGERLFIEANVANSCPTIELVVDEIFPQYMNRPLEISCSVSHIYSCDPSEDFDLNDVALVREFCLTYLSAQQESQHQKKTESDLNSDYSHERVLDER